MENRPRIANFNYVKDLTQYPDEVFFRLIPNDIISRDSTIQIDVGTQLEGFEELKFLYCGDIRTLICNRISYDIKCVPVGWDQEDRPILRCTWNYKNKSVTLFELTEDEFLENCNDAAEDPDSNTWSMDLDDWEYLNSSN